MYHSLQSGRAIAAVLVVLFHLGGAISADKYFGIEEFAVLFLFGGSGVEFFFVLSGFIIFHVHRYDLGKPRMLYSYAYKRITRIYPIFLIVFLVVYCLAMVSPKLSHTVPHDLALIVKSLLLIPQASGAPVLIVAWTLQFEMMFYVSFAIGIVNKRAGQALVVLFVTGSLFGFKDSEFPMSFMFNDIVWLFLMGMMSAKLTTVSRSKYITSRTYALAGLVVYIATALDVVLNSDIFNGIHTLMYGVGFSLIVVSLVLYELDGKVLLGGRLFQLLGASSYALYLIHYPLISILSKASMIAGMREFGVAGALLTFLFIFISCLIVSILFHLVVERPVGRALRSIAIEPVRS